MERPPPELIILMTEPILLFLTPASTYPKLSQELQEIASDFTSKPHVPYNSLQIIWSSSDITDRPSLIQLLSGSKFVLTSSKPREKSEELKARLKKLEQMAERKAYAELEKT